MATETKAFGYMAYSYSEVTFSIPKMCSQALKDQSGLKQGDKIFVIHYLAVDDACKEKGLGKSLVLKALTACMNKAKTDPNLKLIVLHATPTACGFYEKLGFVRVGEVEEDYKKGLTKSYGLVFFWSEYDDFSCGNPYTPYCKIIAGGSISE